MPKKALSQGTIMSNKINVMHMIGSLRIGGAEKVVLTLLKSMDRDKFNVAVCCFTKANGLTAEFENLGIPIAIVKPRKLLDPFCVLRLARLMRKEKIDVLHTHLPDADIMGRIAAKIARVPVVISTLHTVYTEKRNPKIRYRIKTFIDRITGNYFADLMLAVSEIVKDYHIKWAKMNPEKIQILPNPVVLDEFQIDGKFDRIKKKKELAIDTTHKVITNVGSLAELKGQTYLIQAMSQIIKATPQATLLLVGDGPLRSDLEGLVKNLGIGGNVYFAGFRKDIPELLAITDVFVLPSVSEGVSVALLEAMAMEKPAIVTRVGANPDIVEDGINGILVPPLNPDALAKAITNLLEDGQKAHKLGIAGRRKAEERFSSRVVVEKLQSLYRELYLKATKGTLVTFTC